MPRSEGTTLSITRLQCWWRSSGEQASVHERPPGSAHRVFSSSLSPRETNAKGRDFGTRRRLQKYPNCRFESFEDFSSTSSKLGHLEPVFALSESQLPLRQ